MMTKRETDIGRESLFGSSLERIGEISRRYPWFVSARILGAESLRTGPVMELYLAANPCPEALMPEAVGDVAGALADGRVAATTPTAAGERIAEDSGAQADASGLDSLIDNFLKIGERRIVPMDDTPDIDAAAASSEFEIKDDMVSEQLARIYESQGLTAKAQEIYRLLEGKKSKG